MSGGGWHRDQSTFVVMPCGPPGQAHAVDLSACWLVLGARDVQKCLPGAVERTTHLGLTNLIILVFWYHADQPVADPSSRRGRAPSSVPHICSGDGTGTGRRQAVARSAAARSRCAAGWQTVLYPAT
jgi:hypothetical protein